MIHILLQSDFNVNVFAELLKQGPIITMLGIAVMYFYKKQQKNEQIIADQTDKLESYLKDDREKLITVIENNTKIMEDNTRIMQELEKVLQFKSV